MGESLLAGLMLDQFDESDLLAFIEDELGSQEAEALLTRLDQDPRALGVIRSMRRDRELLQSLGDPPLPVDLLAELEPRLARPMLIAPTGDDLRRRQRRERRRYGPLAAAGIGLVVFVGGWFIVSGLLTSTTSDPTDQFAMATNPDADVPTDGDLWRTPRPSVADQSGNDHFPAPGSSIHHRGPLDLPVPSTLVKASSAESVKRSSEVGRQTGRNRSAGRELLAADFAIVLRSADVQDVERSLQDVAESLGDELAVVRNFEFGEAQRLAAMWVQNLRAQVGQSESDARFDATRFEGEIDLELKALSDPKRVAIWARNQLDVSGQLRGSETEKFGEQLHGSRSLAPSLEQQLEYAQRGAAYTIAVPVSQLRGMLVQMQKIEAQATSLRMLRLDDAERSGALVDAVGLENYAQAREAADRLIQQNPDAVILLPVVIQSP